MSEFYVVISKKIAWDADIVRDTGRRGSPDPKAWIDHPDETVEEHKDMAPDWEREAEFGPFPTVEAAREAVRRFRDEDTDGWDVWCDAAYEDLYIQEEAEAC
jgi:hypothetical protein